MVLYLKQLKYEGETIEAVRGDINQAGLGGHRSIKQWSPTPGPRPGTGP